MGQKDSGISQVCAISVLHDAVIAANRRPITAHGTGSHSQAPSAVLQWLFPQLIIPIKFFNIFNAIFRFLLINGWLYDHLITQKNRYWSSPILGLFDNLV